MRRIFTIALIVLFAGGDAPSAAAQAAASSPSQAPPVAASTTLKDDNAAVAAEIPKLDAKLPKDRVKRRAAKFYLSATKLFLAEDFEEAMRVYQQAAKLDPTNANYPLAAEVARNHAVTALIEAAAKARTQGDAAAARAALAHARELNPNSEQVAEHIYELSGDAVQGRVEPLYESANRSVGDAPVLMVKDSRHSFHLYTDMRQIIPQVYQAYGLQTSIDQSVSSTRVHFDIDDASFAEAMELLALVTHTYYEPIDSTHVLIAREARETRQQFQRENLETVHLSGLTPAELGDVGKMATEDFNADNASVDPTAQTITLRGSPNALTTFNAAMGALLGGHNQVMLDVRMIQVAHNNQRNTGAQLPQELTAFNLYSEEQSILNSNKALVQQIISSGLAAPGDTLAILGILIASGQVSSSLFANGIAVFGGGLTTTGLSPGSTSFNLSLNSSDTRQLDQIQLRLGDGEEGRVRVGERYPIQTSTFSSLAASTTSIPGLTSAGNSSGLSSLLASLSSPQSVIPQVQYEDLGLTLKATPKVMRGGDVALTIDLKLDGLQGTSINNVPILNNQSYSGVVTLKNGEGVVVVSELDKSQSRAISGTPGISEIPGLNDLTDKNVQKNYASLLIVITPHVIRATQMEAHSPMLRIETHATSK